MFLVGLGHVFGQGGVSVFAMTSRVTGHAPVFMKDSDGGGGHTHVELFTFELIGNAVIVTIHFDMVIDIDGRFFPLGKLISMGRQRGQRGFVDGFKKVHPGDFHLLQGALVK